MGPNPALSLPFSPSIVTVGSWGLFTAVHLLSGRLFHRIPLKNGVIFATTAFLIGRYTHRLFEEIGREFALLFGIKGRRRTAWSFSLLHRFFYFSAAALTCAILGMPLSPKIYAELFLISQTLWYLIRKTYEYSLKAVAFWYTENFQRAS